MIKELKPKVVLDNLLDNMPGHIYWKDENGMYLGCNDRQAQSLGFRRGSDVIGKTDFELPWDKESAQKFWENDLWVLKTGQAKMVEEPAIMDGQPAIMLSLKAPLKDTSGHVMGVLGISVNITKQKEAEERLIRAKEAAEAADKAKTEFLENMRHDIRTPLTGIVGFANIIAEEVQNPRIKEYVENLTASSHALLDLLNEILEVIKINSNEIALQKNKFNLQKKLSDVIKLNQSKAHHKNIDLLFDYDPKIPHYVIGDATRIHRIALELITNALNFTDKGFVKLTTQLAKKNDQKLIIKLIVEDSGVGIAADKQQDIFLQFKRLTPSSEGIYKGPGLGLSIVKRFVEELDGEIYVESQMGKGSKFTCILQLKEPLLDDAFGSEEIALTKSKSLAQETSNFVKTADIQPKKAKLGKNRILLVEDQAIAAIVGEKMLAALGCEVDIANNGKTAVQLVQEKPYDVIFMDIGLPDMDGYEVTKRIRLYELSHDTHVPIIALTAHVDAGNKQNCLDAGMNAVFSKPLNKEKAEDILNAFIPFREQAQTKEESNLPQLEGKIIDFELAKQLFDGKKEVVDEMLGMLVNGFPEELENLRNAYEKEDWASIGTLAHKMKGGAIYCGTTRLQAACSQMEQAVKQSKKNSFSDLYKQMLNEIEAVKEAVKKKDYNPD
ncbi:MAG: response regulator [Gammaproteobacteria bacterium]